ncbi:transketolase [Georgenia alba]|uniref:Transketolase n=1 Tax=Georgenia alba TaxID=2233858 RepID=A0ABW2Q8K8_9MICO
MIANDVAQTDLWRSLKEDLANASALQRSALLTEEARQRRRQNVRMISEAGQGHIGGDMSVTDILTVLYCHILRIDPANPAWPDRDRLVMSKGHCAGALYTALASCGFIPSSELSTFMAPGSRLNGHPNRLKVPGVEANTGPLGHGLPIAVGIAHAGMLRSARYRVFAVLGDGEMQEGSNWEALMSAAHYQLSNLCAVIDRNRLQQGAPTEETNALDPLAERLHAFGWEVRTVDGHDFEALIDAFEPSSGGRPVAVVANTTKGKGISFMEDDVSWHHKVPTDEQVRTALEELA